MFRTPQRALGVPLASVALAGLVLPVAAAPASAATVISDDVVINEVYGGGGNAGAPWTNDFVELVNLGSEPVSVDGWSVQYFSASGGFGGSTPLTGTIAPGAHYLVQGGAGSTASQALPTPDAVGTFAASATNGTFALVETTTRTTLDSSHPTGGAGVVDLVGYGTATHFSGSSAAPGMTNSTSDSRTSNRGHNGADFVRGAPTPQNSAAAPVDPDPDPDPDPEPTPEPTPGTVTAIRDIQGTGDASPLVGQQVTTRGVVTAVYATGGLDGFVIQAEGTGGAVDPAARTASDGLFVYGLDAARTVAIGDSVEVTGAVSEYYGLTQVSAAASGVTKLATPLVPVAPVTLAAFPTDAAQRETLESMLYLPSADAFTITDVYNTNRFGEVSLVPGDAPLRQPGDVMAPGAEATALYNRQLADVVLLDDAKTTNFTTSAGQRLPFSYISAEEPVRVGAGLSFTRPVVLTYGFDQWRLNPTTPWESSATDGIDFENTRTAAPREVGGDLSIGSFNVLNYFTTLGKDVRGCTSYNDINGTSLTVRGGCDLRGAWDEASLERQTVKIVEAINTLDSSVLGLTEIENSARLGEPADEALAHLVERLNADAGTARWAYVPTAEVMAEAGASAMDQDVITNAIIYQPAKVTLVDAMILADDPAFSNARDPLGAVFAPAGGGEEFFFAINHFKSKGSADADDAGTVSDPVVGNSDASRRRQADAVATWVEGVQAATQVEDVYLAGDFNAYTQERPLQSFYDRGYTNVVHTFEPESWSYTFGSRVGSLDHILANAGGLERLTDATHWMINSPEAVSLQYSRYLNNVTDVYRPDVYASSDHDPVKAGVRASAAVTPVVPTVTATSNTCSTFGFAVTDMPEGARLRIDWTRSGQGQFTSTEADTWWSGTQKGWSNARASVVAADGTVLATSETVNPTGCPVTVQIPTAYHQQVCGEPANDVVLPVAPNAGFTVSESGWKLKADGRTATWTRTYTTNPGYVFPGDTTTHTKVFTDRGLACTPAG